MEDFTGLVVFSILIEGFFQVKIWCLDCMLLFIFLCLLVDIIYCVYITHLFELPIEFVQREKKNDLLFLTPIFIFPNLLQDPSNIYVVSISFV